MILKEKGYIAISSMLVIAAVVLTIGISVSLLSISEGQMSLAYKKSEEALYLVEGCVEDALLKLNEDNAIPASISLPEGSCTITVDSQSGNDWTFTTTGTFNNYTKSIQVDTTRTTTITINSWNQVE